MTTQEKLETAIEIYGIGDRRTIELSEKLDEEVNKAQIKIYEEYKKGA